MNCHFAFCGKRWCKELGVENIGNWNLSTILSLPSFKVSEVIRENAGVFVEEQSEGRSVQNPLHLELHLGAWGSWLPFKPS